MLANRTAGQASSFTIEVVDPAGSKIDGTSASWSLFDERGNTLDAGVVANFDPAADEVTFEVAAASLTLPDGVTSAGREVVVSLMTVSGEMEVRDYFVLVARAPLALMLNSFVTYPEALSVRQSFGPTLDGWDAIDDRETRTGALAEAFERLNRMAFKISYLDPMTHASSYAAYGTGTDMPFDMARRLRLRGLSVEQFDALPEAFRKAIKRAQLIEANILLGGDVVGKKRADGIISESVGESSVFFSSKPYLNLPISKQAYEELKRYVIFHVGVLRG